MMKRRRGNPAAASKKLAALEPFRPAFRPYTTPSQPVTPNNRAAFASWPIAVPSAPLPVVSSSGLGLPQPLPPPPPVSSSSSSLVLSTQPAPSSPSPLTVPGRRVDEEEEGGGGKWRCLSEHRLAQAGCESSPAASFPDRLNPSPASSSSISSGGSTTSEDTSSQDLHVEHPTRFGGAACTHASENPPNGDEDGEDRMGGSPRPLKRQCTQEVGPDGGGGPLGSSSTKEREHMMMQQVKEEHESSTHAPPPPAPVSSSLQQQQQVHQHQQQQQQHEEEVVLDEERAGVERRRALAGGLAVLPEDLVPRFAASLALPRPLTALASAVAEKVGCSGVLDGKPPQLQAASALYLAHFLFPRCAAAASKGAVSKASGVNAQALTKAHKVCAAQWRTLLPADTVAKVGEKTLHRLLARSS